MASKPVPSGSNQHGESQPLDPSDEVLITDQMRMQHFPGRGPIMNQYERRQRIGRGQHGEVHVGINLDTGGWVVCVRCYLFSYCTKLVAYFVIGYQRNEQKECKGR